MKRIMIHRLHTDLDALKADCHNIPYRYGTNNLLCIDVTDEEFVFIKLKYDMYSSPLIFYPDMPTFLILYDYDYE